jgi:SM-20-related protein
MLLEPDDVRMLDEEAGSGYTIKDGFLWGSSAGTTVLRKELETIYAEGDKLRPAAMRARNNHSWAEPDARGDLHMWLDVASLDDTSHDWWAERPQLRAACRQLRRVQEELRQAWGFGSGRLQAQLACYPGGGTRYVRHLDAPPGDNEAGGQRRLTLLYYVNPDWSPADGGCLRMYPKTQVRASQKEEEEFFVDVEPVGDRLLIFQSRTIEHEVLPSHAMRFSLTMWLY